MNWDMCHYHQPAPNSFSRCSPSDMNADRPSSRQTCRSTNGPVFFGSERLTGALLDRLTHHVHILEMNGESFRLKQGRRSTTKNRD